MNVSAVPDQSRGAVRSWGTGEQQDPARTDRPWEWTGERPAGPRAYLDRAGFIGRYGIHLQFNGAQYFCSRRTIRRHRLQRRLHHGWRCAICASYHFFEGLGPRRPQVNKTIVYDGNLKRDPRLLILIHMNTTGSTRGGLRKSLRSWGTSNGELSSQCANVRA